MYLNSWQKEEEYGHLLSIRYFDDDNNLWRSMDDLMMIHGKIMKTLKTCCLVV